MTKGKDVVLYGLAQASLNGWRGTVMEWDDKCDRWTVRINGKNLLVKTGNLLAGGSACMHACVRKPAKPPPPRVEVLAIKAEVARGLARLMALSGMTEPQRQKLTCAYCRWDRQPRHTVKCCLHKPGCCVCIGVCGQAHKGRDCDHLPADMKAAQQALKRARAQKA